MNCVRWQVSRVSNGRRQRRSRIWQRRVGISQFRSESERGRDERHAVAEPAARVRVRRRRSGGARRSRLSGAVAVDDRLLAAVPTAAGGRRGRPGALPGRRVVAAALAGRGALWLAVPGRAAVARRRAVRGRVCSGVRRRQRLVVQTARRATHVCHLRGCRVGQTLRRLQVANCALSVVVSLTCHLRFLLFLCRLTYRRPATAYRNICLWCPILSAIIV